MKRFLAVLLAVVVLFSVSIPKQTAKADGLTLAAIAGGAYAIAAASGMNFGFTGYDGLGVGTWMQNKINSWLAGRSIAEAFGSEAIRLVTGKLLIPSAAVAGIVSFLGDLKTTLGLTENMQQNTTVASRIVAGVPVYPFGATNVSYIPYYSSVDSIPEGQPGVVRFFRNSNWYYQFYDSSHQQKASKQTNSVGSDENAPGWYLSELSPYSATSVNMLAVKMGTPNSTALSYTLTIDSSLIDGGSITARIPGTYTPPEGLNDLQSWQGTVSDAPDTNIDDLLTDIFDQGAAGTLDVSGEVVDTPSEPQVTPVPTAAPGDVIGGLDTISGQLEGIDQTLTGVQEGVGEAVGQLEGINEGIGSISEALDVPTSSEAPAFKFDLTTLFPFCIPFDIYRFVTMFNASPVAPHVQIPFNIPAVGLQYTFDLDFASFDGVASVLRSVELIAFCVGLAILTSKVIRW